MRSRDAAAAEARVDQCETLRSGFDGRTIRLSGATRRITGECEIQFASRAADYVGDLLCASLRELNDMLNLLVLQLPAAASAWIVRPKQHLKPGFNENDVREGGLARGLVDYKICSVDEQWSGMKFARRKPVRVFKA